MILTHTVNVKRETPNAGRTQEGFDTTILQGLKVNIQPSDMETTVISEGAFGKTYTMYGTTTASGVMQSDRITVISGTTFAGRDFVVKGKQDWNIGFGLDHLEFTLFEANE